MKQAAKVRQINDDKISEPRISLIRKQSVWDDKLMVLGKSEEMSRFLLFDIILNKSVAPSISRAG